MNIVFFGSSNFALPILEQLNRHHNVLAVVTTNENPVETLAVKLGLKVLKPAAVKGNQDFLNDLKNLDAEVFIVSAYGMILPDEIIYLPKLKTLNTHPSLLPKYRGPSPIQNALKNGDHNTGISIMVLDSKMDTGPILAQEQYPIKFADNYITLSEKLAKISALLLIEVLPDYRSGKLSPVSQNDAESTYTKIISRDDGRIDWYKSATEIHNMLRAFTPWPGIWTTWEGRKIKITDCEVYQGHPGNEGDPGVFPCGQNTFLKINRLQLEGKKETDINSFLNGHQSFIGAKLL